MKAFHRTKRDSRLLGMIGLAVLLVVAFFFMVVGISDIEQESGTSLLRILFGLGGVALFVVFIRGCWIATGGATVQILSIDEDKFEWGYMGREKELATSEIKEIYWDDDDGFTFVLRLKNGKRIRLPSIGVLIPQKGRGQLLAFLWAAHPEIPITGAINAQTQQAARAIAAAGSPEPPPR
jgi:hypothetical protein